MKYAYLIRVNKHSRLEEEELNELGEKGWELIQILKEYQAEMTESYREYTVEEYHHIFKKVLNVEYEIMKTKGNRNFFKIWLPAHTTLGPLYHDDVKIHLEEDWGGEKGWHDDGFIIMVQVKTEYLKKFCKILEEIGGKINL